MKWKYELIIECEQPKVVERILGVSSERSSSNRWSMCFIESEDDPHIPFVNEFLRVLSGKYEALNQAGIERKNISVWVFYQYDQQCNLEFSSKEIGALGKEGIDLCLSCWKKGDEIEL